MGADSANQRGRHVGPPSIFKACIADKTSNATDAFPTLVLDHISDRFDEIL